jgi:hypothetical protein
MVVADLGLRIIIHSWVVYWTINKKYTLCRIASRGKDKEKKIFFHANEFFYDF